MDLRKGLLGAFGAVLSYIYNSMDVLFAVLVIMMALDYISGLSAAWMHGKPSSRVGLIGIVKKAGYVGLVIVGLLFDLVIDKTVGQPLPVTNAVGTLIVGWLIANEGLSILENLAKLGVPAFAPLNKALDKLKKQFEGGDGQ